MTRAPRRTAWSLLVLACAAAGTGCNQFGPRQRLDESRRTIQALRSENDRLQDQLLTLRNENQDLSERAVDDGRRIAALAEAVGDYRNSIHAYQAERNELKNSYRELRDSLPTAVRSALAPDGDRRVVLDDREPDAPEPAPAPRSERRKPIPTEHEGPPPPRDGWAPARPGDAP
jgi:septal ring factor EnvC (AmiA/AmiB activator)